LQHTLLLAEVLGVLVLAVFEALVVLACFEFLDEGGGGGDEPAVECEFDGIDSKVGVDVDEAFVVYVYLIYTLHYLIIDSIKIKYPPFGISNWLHLFNG